MSAVHRIAVMTALLLLFCQTLAVTVDVSTVRALRLQGELPAAIDVAKNILNSPSADARTRMLVHLELARIHDRIGLHTNTRPVPAALKQIRKAEVIAAALDDAARAAIELAMAEYFYRAEMRERLFTRASLHADRAIESFRQLGDKHGEAEAVHRAGLIAFQKRDLAIADKLFDDSLRLDIKGGERKFFRGEYERHVGYVQLLQGNTPAAVIHFEQSLVCRIDAGAIDASMFAGITLADALVDLERFDEARSSLGYAQSIAERIDSAEGRRRIARVATQMPGADGRAQLEKQTTEIAVAARCPSGL